MLMRKLFEEQVVKLKEVITDEIKNLENEAKEVTKLPRKVVSGLFFLQYKFHRPWIYLIFSISLLFFVVV
jgi:hypothetical protein